MSGETCCDRLVIPTAGFAPGTTQPSPNGIIRMEKAAACVDAGLLSPGGLIYIVGGYRESGPSEAEAYMEYFAAHFPTASRYVRGLKPREKCTARDMVHLLENFPGLKHHVIGLTTYDEHCRRTALTLRSLGCRKIVCYETTEKRHYSEVMEKLLMVITWLDPKWNWLGRGFAAYANRSRR